MNILLIIGAIVIIIITLWIMNQRNLDQVFSNISVEEAKELIKKKEVIPLDVRRPQEIAQGKIGKAIEMEVSNPSFSRNLNDLDKDKTYLVYCRSGQRSALACRLMSGQGFKNLYNLKGGITAFNR